MFTLNSLAWFSLTNSKSSMLQTFPLGFLEAGLTSKEWGEEGIEYHGLFTRSHAPFTSPTFSTVFLCYQYTCRNLEVQSVILFFALLPSLRILYSTTLWSLQSRLPLAFLSQISLSLFVSMKSVIIQRCVSVWGRGKLLYGEVQGSNLFPDCGLKK